MVGSGGIGILYRARQLRLDRPVALKVVEPEVAADPVVRERLRREARTVAALDHPNVVPLYEAGEEDGTVFIVTRWVDGHRARDADPARRPARAAPGGADRRADRLGARGRPREGPRAPRRQALQRDRHLRGPRLPHRLRPHQARRRRRRGSPGRGRCWARSTTWPRSRSRAAKPDAARRRLRARLRPLRDADRRVAVRGRDRRHGQDVGPPQRRAAVGARAARRRAPGARRRDPATAWRSAPTAARRPRRSGPRCWRLWARRPERAGLGAGVQQVRREHDAAERRPRRRRSRWASACRASRRRRAAARRRAVLPAACGRPGRGDERHRVLRAAGRLAGQVVLDRDVGGLASLERRPRLGGDPLPGRVGILGHPHERARGVEAVPRRPAGLAGGADRDGLAALRRSPSPAAGCPRRASAAR